MAVVSRRQAPPPETVTWHGSNVDEVLDLVQRVADLHVWAPLESGVRAVEIRTEEPHLGLNLMNAEGVIVARVEEGNTLVFDLFAETPLFVMAPHELVAFYEAGD